MTACTIPDEPPRRLGLEALLDVPMIEPGDDLAGLLLAAMTRQGMAPRDGDILVVAQKIVSKAEGRYVDLDAVTPSPEARSLAQRTRKDARLVDLILRESKSVIRAAEGVLIVEHRLGPIMANAGIDQSNLPPDRAGRVVLLLPRDPDASAAALRTAITARHPAKLGPGKFGVVIADSFGRPWRLGSTGVAIGVAGLPALLDRRGEADLFGRPLEVTQVALADQLAAAAALVTGEAAEALPAVMVSGLDWSAPASPASALLRPAAQDLFR